MAGLTPFQFSSRFLQQKTSESFTGGLVKSVGNIIGNAGDQANESMSWYEMWINPEKIGWKVNYLQKPTHTAGAIVTFHYRMENTIVDASGYCGWVRIQAESDKNKDKFMGGFISGGKPLKEAFTDPLKGKSKAANNSDNSPRLFLKRLKDLADEPMYFIDSKGIEHYNTKYIKMFTKQFPEGIICEGYFTNFDLSESIDDGETIPYNFSFIVEYRKPVTLVNSVTGMFTGGLQSIGSTVRKF